MDGHPQLGGNAPAQANSKEAKVAQKAEAKAERTANKAKAKAEKGRKRGLAQAAEAKLLKELSLSLDVQARSATFACGEHVSLTSSAKGGGSVVAAETTATPSTEEGDDMVKGDPTNPGGDATTVINVVGPVQMRFGESGKGITAVFSDNGPSDIGLRQLTEACQPASFGRGGKAVLDEGYRKAGKMDREKFTTSFCQYEAAIIDVITQLLVPQLAHDKHSRSIKAELYKLNVYSAPSGKSKPHVDTPRSKDQIGSLVVALPSIHEGKLSNLRGEAASTNRAAGGEPVVRNAGKEVWFDWSSDDGETTSGVKWAAIYSDCEHEVLEVLAGHRVTLTYNLFVTRGAGHLADAKPVLNPTQLPLYDSLETALDTPGFLRRGRVLAVWLTHSYAHTSKHLNSLPHSLKGADMSLWNTAQALGLKCATVPIMSLLGWDEDVTHVYEPRFRGFNQGGSGNFELAEMGEAWGYGMPESKVTWLNPLEEIDGRRKKKASSSTEARGVRQTFKEVQMAYLAYGNEPDIDIHYSLAAMLIRIPPFHERLSNAPVPKSIWEGVKRDPSYYESDDELDEEEEISSMDDDDDDGDYHDGEDSDDDKGVEEGDGAGRGDKKMPDVYAPRAY